MGYGVAQPALQPIQYGTTTTFLAPSPSTTTMLPAVMPAPTPIVKTYTTTVRAPFQFVAPATVYASTPQVTDIATTSPVTDNASTVPVTEVVETPVEATKPVVPVVQKKKLGCVERLSP